MSPVHGNQGQPFARPAAPSQGQNQWGQPQQPQQAGGGYAGGYAAPQGYAPQGQAYSQQAAPAPAQQPAYGQSYGGQPAYGQDYGYAPQAAGAGGQSRGAPASYAPQFEPYTPAAPAPRAPAPAAQQTYAPQGYDFGLPAQPQQAAPQAHAYGAHPQHAQPAPHPSQGWAQPQAHTHSQDARGFDLGTYHPAQQQTYGNAEPGLGGHAQHGNDWAQDGYGAEPPMYAEGQDPAGYGQQGGEYAHDQGGADMGFAQPAGGELDQGYVDEEAQDYEAETPSRLRRPMMIAAVLAGAIVLGGGMTYGFKSLFGGPSAGDPPVVKSAAQPSKFKPEDGGGKQFAHTDSKVMGRLGDGSAAPAAGEAAGSDVDANGTRKVATLVVGRDGTIQAPSAEAPAAAPPAVAVPGLTVVDGLGASRPSPAKAAAQEAAAAAPEAAPAAPTKVVNAPAQKPVTVAKAAPSIEPTGSIQADAEPETAAAAPAPPAKPKKPKTAAAAPAAAPAAPVPSTSVATTGSGFVAVLASVPRSTSSRMDALKRFADMQQKYADVLSGKTPDVAEANLGAKGNYHRLVVGPPGSREQASAVCSQLKTQGYADCWVTSY